MKRLFIVAIIFMLALSLVACTENTEPDVLEPPAETADEDTATGDEPDPVGAEETEEPSDGALPETGIQVGLLAPDFTVELAGGGERTLSELRGSVVFLNFWASWCGPCVGEMPHIAEIAAAYPDVKVLAVSVSDSPEEVAAFMEDNGFSFEAASGSDELSATYNIQYIPATFILDADGVIRFATSGGLSYAQMEEAIAKAQAE